MMSDEQVLNTNPVQQQAVTSSNAVEGTQQSVYATVTTGESYSQQSGDRNFSDQIPEEFRNEASLTNIKDMNALVKGYVHAQKELGSRVRIPSKDASPEVIADFNKKVTEAGYVKAPDLNDPKEREGLLSKLGRPETPDGYDAIVPQDVEKFVDQGRLKEYREIAHSVGLSKEQAKALLEFEINSTMDRMGQSYESAQSTLKQEWGDAFDTRLGLASEGLNHFASKYPEAVHSIRNGIAANNPVVIMMASELGKMYKESEIIVGDRSVNFGLTPHEARSRIEEIKGNPTHAHWNESDPNHWAAIEEVEQLYKAAYPEDGQSR